MDTGTDRQFISNGRRSKKTHGYTIRNEIFFIIGDKKMKKRYIEQSDHITMATDEQKRKRLKKTKGISPCTKGGTGALGIIGKSASKR